MATKKALTKRRDYSPDTRKIKIIIRENPHREGTGRYNAFEAVRTARTVADYAASGNKPKYLKTWKTSGHIALIRPVSEKAKAAATAEASK